MINQPIRPIWYKILSMAFAIFGYAIVNAALYFLSNAWMLDYEINCLQGECDSDLAIKNNYEMFEKFFSDPEHILAFVITVVFFAAQVVSGYRNYYNLIYEVLTKGNNPLTKIEVERLIDESQSKISPEAMSEKIKKFVFMCADVTGTYSKVLGNLSTLLQLLGGYAGKGWDPTIWAIIQSIFANGANFAVFGRDYSIKVFFSSILGYMETLAGTAATFLLARKYDADNLPFITLAVWASLLFVQILNIAGSQESIGYRIGKMLLACWQRANENKEPQLLVNDSTTPKLPWYSICCSWGSESKVVTSEAQERLLPESSRSDEDTTDDMGSMVIIPTK